MALRTVMRSYKYMRLLVPLEVKILETGLQTHRNGFQNYFDFWERYMSPTDSAEGENFRKIELQNTSEIGSRNHFGKVICSLVIPPKAKFFEK